MTLELTGSLDGCLYTHVDSYKFFEHSGIYIERGREMIEACLGDKCGTVETRYVFISRWKKGAQPFDPGAQIWGGCIHPIVNGAGDFKGGGLLIFKDNIVDGDAVNFDYRGHVNLANGA